MAYEIATAYVSIVPETSKIAPGVKAALGKSDSHAAAAGKSMGGKMSAALGTALKAGAATAVAAGVATLGVAMTKGFQRLQAIDDAKGKLEGLGHSAASTGKIMDSALASVKGTAYGLGDAATIAAGAVAAGIKPGQELTKYLSMTADAASIAGVELNEMGSIMNKVQTGGKAMTNNLNELADRGIPIYQWLAEEVGVAADEVQALASKGKISSEQFFAAIDKNIGGAAQAAGKTVRGSFQNMIAALGRLGAAAQTPLFERLPGMFTKATDAIDKVTPKVTELATAFSAKVFDEWGPKIRDAFNSARDTGAIDKLMGTLRGLWAAARDMGPALGTVFTELGRASAAVGVGTWQLFLTALQAVGGALTAITPALKVVGDLMKAHPALVVAAVAAWTSFKTVPGLLKPMGTSMESLAKRAGEFGTSVAAAYREGSDGATRFTRTAGVAAVGMKGLKSAGSGLLRMFGGPWGIALGAAGGVLTMVMSQIQRSKQRAEEYRVALGKLRDTQVSTNAAMMKARGASTEEVYAAMTAQVEAFVEVADQGVAAWKSFDAAQSGLNKFDLAGMPDLTTAMQDLGITSENVSRSLNGSTAEWEHFVGRLQSAGVPEVALSGLQDMRRDIERTRAVAKAVAPGMTELSDAVRVLGDSSASAAEKSKALKSALDALNPARTGAEAVAQHSAMIDKIAESTQAAVDQTKGFGAALLDAKNGIDGTTENGRSLLTTLLELRDTSVDAAAAGEYTAEMHMRTQQQLAALGKQYGLTADEIQAAADKLGMTDIDILMTLSGKDEVTRGIGEISLLWSKTPESKTLKITEDKMNDQVRARLEKMGLEVGKPMNGVVTITAKTDKAKKDILAIQAELAKTPSVKPVKVDTPGGKEVLDLLKKMNVEVESNNSKTIETSAPLAEDVLTKLREIGYEVVNNNGKTVVVKADDTDYQGKKREWTETVYKQIIAQGVGFGDAVPGGGRFRGPGIAVGADGMIVPYVNGGIAAAEAFANGGLKHIPKPTRADIYAGRGAGTIFAEEETGGEAYIPLAPGKRSRSTDILATVADLFGLAVVPKDSISGMLGAIAGGAVSKLLAKAGADNLTRFADGGFSGKQLRELAEGGHGASQPLTGAPYAWSGVNWGDCSGAQSGFTRAAAGLDPFGGRWSTGSAGSDLPAMGYERGRWEPGFMGVGVKHGGPGGGHTAGTLPDGTNVEMGGSYGGGMMGGSVGANDGQFTEQWRLRVADDVADPVPSSPYDPTAPAVPYDPSSPQPSTQPVDTSTSFSQKLGNAAGEAVTGQLSSLFGVLGISDSPGALAAYNELQSQQSQHRQGQQNNQQQKKAPRDPGTTNPKPGEDGYMEEDQAPLKSPHGGTLVDYKNGTATYSDGSKFNGKTWTKGGKVSYMEEDQSPLKSPDGGKLVDFSNGKATYSDGYTFDGNKWSKGGKSFDLGGLARGIGLLPKNTVKPERVLDPRQTKSFEEMVKRDFQSGIGTDEIVQRLDRLIALTEQVYEKVGSGDTYNWVSDSAVEDVAKVKRERRQSAILAGV